ncbi:MAG: hypothetical protein HQ542_09760 [Bacteroidia bacterium]|nr:hypothetical protein [Bacteroidia bacterium]
MEERQSHKNDLREIKSMMEKSTRFLSLSGLSSISAGIVALIGAFVAFLMLDYGSVIYTEKFYQVSPSRVDGLVWYLLVDAILVMVVASIFGIYFSWRKAKRRNLPFWNQTAKRTLYSFAVPLLIGGVFTIILMIRNDVTLVASSMLIFYGLALFCASKYTFSEIQYLGLSEIVLGILAGIFINFGLIFWALGFGVLHIIYGIILYTKYS